MLARSIKYVVVLSAAISLDAPLSRPLPLYCKAQDTLATHLVYKARRFTTEPSYAAFRIGSLNISEQLVEADVAHVTDEAICQQAALAYDRDMSPETPTVNRGVYVVRLKDWYLVADGEDKLGEWTKGYIVTTAFAKHSDAIAW